MGHLARLVPSAALVAVIVGGVGTAQAGPQAALSVADRDFQSSRGSIRIGSEQPISDLTYSAAAETQQNVDIASSGDEYLVVWEDRRSGMSSITGRSELGGRDPRSGRYPNHRGSIMEIPSGSGLGRLELPRRLGGRPRATPTTSTARS